MSKERVDKNYMEKTFNIYEFVNRRHITRIAYATVIEHENYVYCKYFEVNENYRGEGYGKSIIDDIFVAFPNKPIRYALTSKDSLGAKFWYRYIEDKKVMHIKGLTYEIQRS